MRAVREVGGGREAHIEQFELLRRDDSPQVAADRGMDEGAAAMCEPRSAASSWRTVTVLEMPSLSLSHRPAPKVVPAVSSRATRLVTPEMSGLMTDTETTDAAVIESRTRELAGTIDSARIASVSQAARAQFPGVVGVILTPPEATELDGLSPELWDQWETRRVVARLNERARPWDRLLLATGEVVVDAERAAAIVALFEGISESPIAPISGLFDNLDTAEVLELIGWPSLVSTTADEAAHDARAREDESFRDSYESARHAAAGDLYALLDLRTAPDTHDVEALTAEHDRLVGELRRSATAHLVGQVLAQFADVASFVVGQGPSTPEVAELLTVTDQSGNDHEPRDDGNLYAFDLLGGVELDGESVAFEPFVAFSTLTGEPFSEGTRITLTNGAAQ